MISTPFNWCIIEISTESEKVLMKNTDIHEVIVTRHGFNILSADTEFYIFIGERLYDAFDRLILEEDRKLFYQQMETASGEEFLLRLLSEDGGSSYFFVRVKEGTAKTNAVIYLINTAGIVEAEQGLRQMISVKNTLLELHRDTYFECNPSDDTIKLYTLGKSKQNVVVDSLEQFERNLLRRALEKDVNKIRQFIRDIRHGARRCDLQADTNLVNDEEQISSTTIQAASLYENGRLTVVAGYIHLGPEYRRNIHKSIEMDSLTGLMAKAEITNAAIDTIDVRKIPGTTIAIIDVDYFKKVNDTYGHLCGDEVLKKVAGIIEKAVGDSGQVGRIGGDEFFVIFYQADSVERIREHLRSIKNAVHVFFPENDEGKPVITLSIGCAAYPQDADNYEDLFVLADFALYLAKERGRDRYVIFDRKKHGTRDDIKNMQRKKNRIDSRGDMSRGDILCVMMDQVYREEEYPLEKLLDDFVVNFGIQRIMIYAGTPYRVACMAGEKRPPEELISETESYVSDADFQENFDKNGIYILNDVKYLKDRQGDVFEMLQRQGVLSFIQIRFWDKCGTPGILSLESVSRRITWNRSYLHYYRLFARLLFEYEILK